MAQLGKVSTSKNKANYTNAIIGVALVLFLFGIVGWFFLNLRKTGDYFKSEKLSSFFPEVPVLFTVTKMNEKLHIPLLLSQYGYSTYKGS